MRAEVRALLMQASNALSQVPSEQARRVREAIIARLHGKHPRAPRIVVTDAMVADVLAAWIDEGLTPEQIAAKPTCSGCAKHRAGDCLLNRTRAVMRYVLRMRRRA